jgi:hypothetical protein
MSTSNELTGPDLGKGVATADLADGKMLVGHFQGEAVLLARRGDAVFAVGASWPRACSKVKPFAARCTTPASASGRARRCARPHSTPSLAGTWTAARIGSS